MLFFKRTFGSSSFYEYTTLSVDGRKSKEGNLLGHPPVSIGVRLSFWILTVLVCSGVTGFAKPCEDKDDIYDRDQEKQ